MTISLPPISMRSIWLAIPLLALLILLAFFAFFSKAELVISGTLEADEANIGSRVGGRVEKVYATEGQTVHKGDILVSLEAFDLLARQAEAKAKLEAQETELARLNSGYETEQIESAKANRDAAKAFYDKMVSGARLEDIKATQAKLRQAQANLHLTEQTYKRRQQLYEKQGSSLDERDKAENAFLQAQASVQEISENLKELESGNRPEEIEEARSKYEAAQQDFLRLSKGYRAEDVTRAKFQLDAAKAVANQLQAQIDELKIKAPIDGLINALELVPGDLIPANQSVITIVDNSHYWMRAYIPQGRLSANSGSRARIRFDALPKEEYEGHISFISSQGEFTPSNVQTSEDRSEQVFRIKVTIDGPLEKLRPGMSADIYIKTN